MKILHYGSALVVAFALCSLGCNQPHDTTSNSAPDRQSLKTPAAANNSSATAPANIANATHSFWTEAAIGGMAEVELGKLAQSKATNNSVKEFGQMMVVDHSRANDELKEVAARKNVALPTSIDSKHQSEIERLKGLSGAEFDRAYVELMVDDHEEDVQKFEEQADKSTDADAKAFAEKTLPTLRRHLEAIKNVQAKLK